MIHSDSQYPHLIDWGLKFIISTQMFIGRKFLGSINRH